MCRTSTTRLRDSSLRRAAAGLAGALLLAACSGPASDGPATTETRTVGDFHALRVGGTANATIRVGPAPSVTVTASAGTLARLTTEVRNGTLVVEQKGGWFWNGDDVKLQITVPALREVTVNGAGNVEVQEARGESLRLTLQGAGNVVARGEVDQLDVTINGAGNGELSGLRARTVKAVVNGAGTVTVHAVEALDAVVNGVGKLRYVGSPAKLDTRINGVGNVSQIPALET